MESGTPALACWSQYWTPALVGSGSYVLLAVPRSAGANIVTFCSYPYLTGPVSTVGTNDLLSWLYQSSVLIATRDSGTPAWVSTPPLMNESSMALSVGSKLSKPALDISLGEGTVAPNAPVPPKFGLYSGGIRPAPCAPIDAAILCRVWSL